MTYLQSVDTILLKAKTPSASRPMTGTKIEYPRQVESFNYGNRNKGAVFTGPSRSRSSAAVPKFLNRVTSFAVDLSVFYD